MIIKKNEKKRSIKFQKSIAIDRKICYNIAKIKSIILIKSSVVTGTMMLQQPADDRKVLNPVR